MENKEKELSELTNEELLVKAKKAKSDRTTFAFLIGMMLGITIYSTVRNGLGFFTFLPLFFLPIAALTNKNYKAFQAEVKKRNL